MSDVERDRGTDWYTYLSALVLLKLQFCDVNYKKNIAAVYQYHKERTSNRNTNGFSGGLASPKEIVVLRLTIPFA